MDAKEILAGALQAVQDASIPSDLREVAFGRAVDILLIDAGFPPGRVASAAPTLDAPTTADTGSTAAKPPHDPKDPEQVFYASMSEGTGVSVERLERLVHIEDGAPRVSLKSSQLPDKNAAAQKIVAILISVSRHYYNDESEVPLSFCIDECKSLKCFDTNFLRNVNSIADLTISSDKKTARVRNPLIKSFAEILTKLGVEVE